jgi:DNA-binding CsgD family transcriptional regulator
MQYPAFQWNWTTFFEQSIPPVNWREDTVTQLIRELLSQSFESGVRLIVASVPALEHRAWAAFRAGLKRQEQGNQHPHLPGWLVIADDLWRCSDSIWMVLSADITEAVKISQRHLSSTSELEQFAWMACLYHHAGAGNVQAQMLFNYLLPSLTAGVDQLAVVRAFYLALTARQQEVATWAARGMTNQEIAAQLCIEPSVVAEHLTRVFSQFETALGAELESYARRYRLIHWLTLLFEREPDLACYPAA